MLDKIACCYFPTTILFVDDRQEFLHSLALNLDENFAYKTYNDPIEALHFLKENVSSRQFATKLFSNLKDELAEEIDEAGKNTIVRINVADIYQQIYKADRFHTISVVVIDYAMPSMNGLDFCKQVNDLPIKKFMITGEASNELAVKAFNEGVINKFIKKNSVTFYDELNKGIKELQEQYFYQTSKNIVANLATHPDCCLDDVVFVKFFNQLCVENKIIEYYLMDEFGSYLLLDLNGQPSLLIIESESIVENYCNIAKDNGADSEVINLIEARQKIPFFFTDADRALSVDKWHAYLHPATELIGNKNKYFYSLISDPASLSIYELNTDKITPYQNYLDTLIA